MKIAMLASLRLISSQAWSRRSDLIFITFYDIIRDMLNLYFLKWWIWVKALLIGPPKGKITGINSSIQSIMNSLPKEFESELFSSEFHEDQVTEGVALAKKWL